MTAMKSAILVLSLVLVSGGRSEANSCGGIPNMIRAARAPMIILATVTGLTSTAKITYGADGSVSGYMSSADPVPTELTIQETLQGEPRDRIRFLSEYRFTLNEQYLIYGEIAKEGGLDVKPCMRVVPAADAVEDLRYLKSLRAGPEFGVVSGQVTRERADGTFEGPKDLFTLVAQSASERREIRTRPYGSFELAIPQGSYWIWVEQDGRQLTNPRSINVSAGTESMAHLQIPRQ
jgi:hypothetical protein